MSQTNILQGRGRTFKANFSPWIEAVPYFASKSRGYPVMIVVSWQILMNKAFIVRVHVGSPGWSFLFGFLATG